MNGLLVVVGLEAWLEEMQARGRRGGGYIRDEREGGPIRAGWFSSLYRPHTY